MKEGKSKLQMTGPSASRVTVFSSPSPILIPSLTDSSKQWAWRFTTRWTPPTCMHDVTCAAAHAKWQFERRGWVTECTCFCKIWYKIKGYGLQNILLRSTFSLQYGQVCFFPTIHQPRMQNSWNLHWVSLRKSKHVKKSKHVICLPTEY